MECGLHVCEPLPPRWLAGVLAGTEVTVPESAGGKLDARFTLSGRNVLVRGSVRAELEMPCARCLAPAPVVIDGELTLLLVPVDETTAKEHVGRKLKSGLVASTDEANAAERQFVGGRGRARAAVFRAGRAVHGEVSSRRQDVKTTRSAVLDGEDDGRIISAGDSELDTYLGEEVVLDDFIREAILLELPMFPLCCDACPGIKPRSFDAAGVDAQPVVGGQSMDPRLAPLLELVRKSKA